MDIRTAHALVRFGLGCRGTEPLPSDPSSWLLDQLRRPDPTRLDDLPTTAGGLAALRQDRAVKPPPGQSRSAALFRKQAAAQLANAVTTPTPFRERLVWFWTNHFTISRRQGACACVAAAFVQEAIRPHVTGHIGEMLLAVMRHPAMLLYLGNARSFGPDSRLGQRTHRGLNENLARECLELHTVSPAAGYSQADVTAFANILTGWSIELKADPLGFCNGRPVMNPARRPCWGSRFPPTRKAALRPLRSLPIIRRPIASLLPSWFAISSQTTRRLTPWARSRRYCTTPRAISARPRRPWCGWRRLGSPGSSCVDYLVASVRSLDISPGQLSMLGVLSGLGQPLWTASAPNGWPDQADNWAAPEAMLRRIVGPAGLPGTSASVMWLKSPMPPWVPCCVPTPARQSTERVLAATR